MIRLSLYIGITLFFIACQQKTKSSAEEIAESEEIVGSEETMPREVVKNTFKSIAIDANRYKEVFESLKGIEKYYVQNNLYRLHSLLKFKADEHYIPLENDLNKRDEDPNFMEVTLIDNKNGSIEFHQPQTECVQAVTYWNKSNGDKLIGETLVCCTMFCEGDISFLNYEENSKKYTTTNIKDVITDYDFIQSQKDKKGKDGGFDYEFKLPKTGKNIEFCLDDKCTDLIWQDGTFTMIQ